MNDVRSSAKSHLRNSGRNDNLAEVARGIGYALLYIGDVLARQDPHTRRWQDSRGPEGMEEKSSPMGDLP